MNYIETDCTITYAGQNITSGGAYVSSTYIVAYPRANGILGDWHGKPIGTWRTVASWPTPRSYRASRMCQIEATVDHVTYTGRGAGEGMIFKGKAKKGEK